MAKVTDAGPPHGFDKPWKVVQDASGRIIQMVTMADGSGALASPRLSAFGEMDTVSPTPASQMKFITGIVPVLHDPTLAGSGTVTATGGLASAGTGTTTASVARLESHTVMRHGAGQGADVRVAGFFTTPVAGTTQVLGIGSGENALGFGYNGEAFGVLRRTGGQYEIRVVTVSAAASGAGTIVITLNSGAGVNVTISGAMTIGEVAREIADEDYSGEGGGWETVYAANRVFFYSAKAVSRSGTYSFAAGATGSAGSVAQTIAGSAPTETWVAQTAWDDKANNTGQLPAMDWTKGNEFIITYQWPFGAISFSVEDPASGYYVCVHRIEYANANTVPSLLQPDGYLMLEADNLATTDDIVVKAASLAAFNDGPIVVTGPRHSVSSGESTDDTRAGVLIIRIKTLNLGGTTSGVRAVIDELTFGNDGSKAAEFRIYLNPTIVGTPVWTDVNATDSEVEICTAAFTVTGGERLFTEEIGSLGGGPVPLLGDRRIVLDYHDMLAIDTGLTTTGTSAILTAGLSWREDV